MKHSESYAIIGIYEIYFIKLCYNAAEFEGRTWEVHYFISNDFPPALRGLPQGSALIR